MNRLKKKYSLDYKKSVYTRSDRKGFSSYAHFYLQREKGRALPNSRASVRIALVYPNAYEIGMANLGFQTVYRLFNAHPHVRCERAFLYPSPWHQEIRTLESGLSIARFDFIGFSIAYELDILNVVQILYSAGIPPLRKERTEAHPIVFFGGVLGGLNPSPLLPFGDAFLAGEGEGIIEKIAEVLVKYRKQKYAKQQRLEALSQINGIFVQGISHTVEHHVVDSLDVLPIYTSIVTPFSHFANMFVVELSRGCPWHCYFCAGSKVYHPFRVRSPESVLEIVKQFNPGASRIGLESVGLSDYPELEDLCDTLLQMGFSLSFSSLRMDRISWRFVEILQRANIRSFTIAPESGSEQIRKRIRKGITDAQLYTSIERLSQSPVQHLKLYFLLGLPREGIEEAESIAHALLRIKDIFCKNHPKRSIRVSINSFIPKPWTEFQWAGMAPESELKKKWEIIKKELNGIPQIECIPKNIRNEKLQALIARGDERVGLAIYDKVIKGISWRNAFQLHGLDPAEIHEEKSFSHLFPWDFIQTKIQKSTLWLHYQAYLRNTKEDLWVKRH